MTRVYEDPYASGVLDEGIHHRLVADIDRLSTIAGVKPSCLWSPFKGRVNSDVFNWVVGYKRHLKSQRSLGLCLEGPDIALGADQIDAIAGVLLRNFIDARVVPVSLIQARIKAGDLTDPSCLLIPDFFLGDVGYGIKRNRWEISNLYDIIFDRCSRGKLTVLYITSLKNMRKEYGSATCELIEAKYDISSIDLES